ncbi:MAG: DNA polymerase III subunit beta, partial [Paludibacteraceae bacterium]|nr:DNA polymerase III subunit beta [Paludibacteraceae bacterium]
MKFIVSSTSLLSHLQSISRVIGSKNTMPILDNFLFKVEDGKLTVTASDLETTLVTSLEIEQTEGEGLIAISAKMLLDILKEFSEQPLTFSVNESTLEVSLKSSLGVYNLVGQSGDEFPILPTLEEENNSFVIESSQLASGINKTIFATATDDLRPTMTGILFDIKNECLIFVATDAHRLVRFMNKTVKSDKELSFILPQKPANILKGILA